LRGAWLRGVWLRGVWLRDARLRGAYDARRSALAAACRLAVRLRLPR